jgi:hypothetical protein
VIAVVVAPFGAKATNSWDFVSYRNFAQTGAEV